MISLRPGLLGQLDSPIGAGVFRWKETVTPDHSEFVTSTVTSLRTRLEYSTPERRRGILEELLTLLRDLKTSQHPAAASLAAAVGCEIIPLFDDAAEDEAKYPYEREEERVARMVARQAADSMMAFRSAECIDKPVPFAAAFRFWNAPCFMSADFEEGLGQLFLDVLRTAGRGRQVEVDLYQPLADAASDEAAMAEIVEKMRPAAIQFVLDKMAGIRKNDRAFQYLCLERLKTHSIENGYHLYNDLDFAFLESMMLLPGIQVQRIHKKIQEAWNRDLSGDRFAAELEDVTSEVDIYVLDCAILSAVYHRQGCSIDVRPLYQILIGASRNMEESCSLRPVLTGELMRVPNHLAFKLAEGDEAEIPYRFGLLVSILAVIGRANLPGLTDQILSLIWGRKDLRGLIDWINAGYPPEDLPELIEHVEETARRAGS